MARQYSSALTGVQIDAIYHTAIVLNRVEYFYGQGIHRKVPGSTHHGRPMKVIHMGRTELPLDVIEEYIQSLESIYTPESYDLFVHNCNNFTQDLSVFLVGKSIPNEISSLPETFLRTPIGQMLRGQIDQSMRTMTQAPDAVSGRSVPKPVANGSKPANGATTRPAPSKPAFVNGKAPEQPPGHVHNITDSTALSQLLQQASDSCAVIFFTSATCPPCKIAYPAYDELAHEASNKATLIKVDISQAYDIASRYNIRATPTFKTFLRGKEDDTWSGANVSTLLGNVRLLVQTAHPQHPHTRLNLPSFHSLITTPIIYTKLPPLDKLTSKLGSFANDLPIKSLTTYIRTFTTSGPSNAPLPDLPTLSKYITTTYPLIPLPSRFALVDLLRVAAIDSRFSSYLATEDNHSILRMLLNHASWADLPFQLRLVTCQCLCNLFSSSIFQDLLCQPSNPLSDVIQQSGISDSLIAPPSQARQSAAALVYNLIGLNHNARILNRPDPLILHEDMEVALVSAVVSEDTDEETLKSCLLALGMGLYMADTRGALWEVCGVMDVEEFLKGKEKMEGFKRMGVLREVGRELLGKGAEGL